MNPRFIMKTHTESLRPRNFSMLISTCTYSDQSALSEIVIKRLSEWLDKSVAKFTVLLSTEKNRGFGFLNDNMTWSWKGHVINLALIQSNKSGVDSILKEELTKVEKLCHLRFFLETEGALILKFAEILKNKGELAYSYLKDNIQNIFKEIIENYIDIVPDMRTRLKLKDFQSQMKKDKYDESTIAHKIKPHLQALCDLGILVTTKRNNEEIYVPEFLDGNSTFSTLITEIGNLENLEKAFSNYDYFSMLSKIYNLHPQDYSTEIHINLFSNIFSFAYDKMKNKVSGLADIEALINWCCIAMLSEHNILARKEDVGKLIDKFRNESPSKINLHVDGKGNIAYVVFNK